MFYPVAVMTVATIILGVLMVFVVPKFKTIFADMLGGQTVARVYPVRPGHQRYHQRSFHLHRRRRRCHLSIASCFSSAPNSAGLWDKFKLNMPVLRPVISKVAISRFTRTPGHPGQQRRSHSSRP